MRISDWSSDVCSSDLVEQFDLCRIPGEIQLCQCNRAQYVVIAQFNQVFCFCPLLIMEGSKNRPITGPIGLAKLNRDITVMPGLNGAFRNGGARLRGEDGQRREGGKDDNTELQESISFDSICRSSHNSAFTAACRIRKRGWKVAMALNVHLSCLKKLKF